MACTERTEPWDPRGELLRFVELLCACFWVRGARPAKVWLFDHKGSTPMPMYLLCWQAAGKTCACAPCRSDAGTAGTTWYTLFARGSRCHDENLLALGPSLHRC